MNHSFLFAYMEVTVYKKIQSYQVTFYDFNQSCGMELSSENEWCRLGDQIAWNELEETYSKKFPGHTGRPAFSVRMALGALIIQKRMKLSDRALVKAIAENPYYQYFIGLQRFTSKCPFTAPALVSFRKRLDVDSLIKFNEICLKDLKPTPEHQKTAPEKSENGENVGTMILDATASPSNIRFPQDFSLLNEAREKTDHMIDILHKQFREKLRPRTYREVLHASYLNVAKSKKRTAKAVRSLIRKLLCAVKRNLLFVDSYLDRGGILTKKELTNLETIRLLYVQQKEMFDGHTHRVDNHIVSISQPYIRPIVRGKAKAPVEFGAKYDVSVDEKGHARLEKISFDAYNECNTLKCALERYKTRTGHYPKRILVDKIYNTSENRQYCRENGIRLSGRGPGRPPKPTFEERKIERQDNIDRNEVERFFSREKRTCGAALIVTKLEETTLSSIALSVFVANLFGIPFGPFFIIFLLDVQNTGENRHFLKFFDADDKF